MSDWKIKRQVLRAASFAMVLFGLLAVYIIYLSTWEADDLAKNPLNMRRAAARADIQRGSILAADGQILAETRQDGSRVYPFGTTMAAVTGYNGENIGSAGIEGHANQALLGLTADMSRLGPLSQLLQSERGNDVKLTIEPSAQNRPRMTRMTSSRTGRRSRGRRTARFSTAPSRGSTRRARPSR